MSNDLSILLAGIVCFKVFDMDRDGVLNFNEIKEMIDILIYVAKESSNSSNFRNFTAENVLAELSQRVGKGSPTVDGVTEVCSFIENVLPYINVIIPLNIY